MAGKGLALIIGLFQDLWGCRQKCSLLCPMASRTAMGCVWEWLEWGKEPLEDLWGHMRVSSTGIFNPQDS